MLAAVVPLIAAQLNLAWEAPPACPDQAAMHASVVRWLGPSTPPPLDVRGEVFLGEDRVFRLTLDIAGRGVRRLEGQSCGELAEAAALVLALLLDPALLTRPVAPAPAPEREISFDVGVHGVADWGATPSLAPGWHAALGFEAGILRLEAFGGTFLEQRAQGSTFSLDFDVGLRPCVLLSRARFQPMVCGALAAGRVSATAAVNTPRPASNTWAAVFAGAGLSVRLFWKVFAVLHLEAGVPLVRTGWTSTNDELIWAMQLFAARGELGLTVRLW